MDFFQSRCIVRQFRGNFQRTEREGRQTDTGKGKAETVERKENSLSGR